MKNTKKIKRLYQAIENERNSYKEEVKDWFYVSEDENLRSVCFEYMRHFGGLDNGLVLDALKSDEFGLVCLALEEVNLDSGEEIKEQLVKITRENDDSFLVAWALFHYVFHYVFHNLNDVEQFEPLKFKWRNSPIVGAALCFLNAAKKEDYDSISVLLKYLSNNDYEVRALSIRASEYFFGSAFETLVVSNLKNQEAVEEVFFLKELIQEIVTLSP